MTEFVPINWNQVDAVVADLDGTLYLGEQILPGAHAFVREAAAKCPLFFLSNNTSKTPQATLEKLLRLDFTVYEDQLLSPLHSLVDSILQTGLKQLWVMANADVLAWLAWRLPGIELRAERSRTECVVLAYDNTLVYADLCEVMWRLQDGASYWITHPDFVCPDPQGSVPDVGGLVELFFVGTGRRPERTFGKPNPDVLAKILNRFTPERVLFIGDRLYTDYELSKQANCQFRLVLSGETTEAQWLALTEDRPQLLRL